MKILITIAFLTLTIASFGQINDEDAFFEGTYSKDYIKKHKVKTIISRCHLDTIKVKPEVFHFSKAGLLQVETTFDSTGKELPLYAFKYDKQGELIPMIEYASKGIHPDTVKLFKTYKGGLLKKESSFLTP